MAVKKTEKSTSHPKSSPAKKGKTGGSKAHGKPPGEAASDAPAATAAPNAKGKLRVRMYRVGFGDFFMLTVLAPDGAKHILIDCGVHAKDIGTIQDAVKQMQKDCDSKLSLVIMTHRHADHISGFGKCSDIFSQITVDRVWMPWFENPKNQTATAFQAGLTALAGRLTMRLAARNDPEAEQFISMADNITGGLNAAGVSANQKALDVLHNGFKNKPEHDYYQAGDPPKLPQGLIDAGLSAQILGPPIDPSLISQMTSKSQQYLAEAAEPDDAQVKPPFSDAFRTDAKAYPAAAFTFYKPDEIAKMVDESQPDVLAAKAQGADNTLNNQSLVVLFSVAGKNLLFAGDAQWGNWENFLYGGRYGTPGHMDVTKTATDILGKIDFYKVGHHGSANATPKGAVAAMRHGCVGMCSTQMLAYPGVPRDELLTALSDRMAGQLARSDQAMISSPKWDNPKAGPVPSLFKHTGGTLYIDYEP